MKRALMLLCMCCVLSLAACTGGEDANPLASRFPSRMSTLRLGPMLTGQEALDAVNKLHGKSISMEEAVIARYEGETPEQGVTVWASRAANEASAREQAAVMVEKMLNSPNSPFADPKTLRVNGTEVFRVSGMGQVHYVFFDDDLVWWISAETAPTDEEESSILATFLDPVR